jgi:hypothetical protein
MWKAKRATEGKIVVLNLSGRIQREHLVELREVLATEAGNQRLELDLADVKLVDQDTVRFLADCEGNGIKLRGCPAYIRAWIARGREKEPPSG